MKKNSCKYKLTIFVFIWWLFWKVYLSSTLYNKSSIIKIYTFCKLILFTLALNISTRINNLDKTHNIGFANSKTFTSFTTLLHVIQ